MALECPNMGEELLTHRHRPTDSKGNPSTFHTEMGRCEFPSHQSTGGASEGEEKEYAQIWERHISVARRCLGKGKAKDKIVLDSAMWHILCAEEEKAGVPMEVEEHGAKDT